MSTSLSDQMSAIRSSSNKSRPEVRIISQVTAQIRGDDAQRSFEEARSELLEWLVKSQNIQAIPPEAWDGHAFEIDSTEGRPVTVETLDQFWGLRYDNPDAQVPGRFWRTEAILGCHDGRALAGVRLTVVSRDWGVHHYKSVPKIVRSLVSAPGLEDYGFPLSEEPFHVSSAAEVGNLIQLLESTGRCRPVFVVSQDGDGKYAIDAEHLAVRTAGIAHVVTIDERSGWQLSDEINASLSVYGGSVRTYAPGFDRYSARFREHRLATAEWITQRLENPEALVGLLTLHAIDASVSLPDLEDRLPSFAVFRRFAAEKRLREAKAGNRSQEEMLSLYETENSNLQSELETALQIAQEAEDKTALYRSGQEDLEAIVFGLKQRIDSLKGALNASGREESIDIPENLTEIDQWIPRYLGDSIHLLGRALRGARKSTFQEIELVYRCLLLLGGVYRNSRLGLASQDDLKKECESLGVEVSSTGDRTTLMQWRDQYEVDWKKQRQFLDLHIKKGASHDPRFCLRMYFFWDDELEQVVIGHMTDHLTSSHS